jgi:hypothetical protein
MGQLMQIEAVRTIDHDEIMRWTKDRHGTIGRIAERETPGLGQITIYFPDRETKPDNFEEIPWDEFLEDFENKKYEFVYQEMRGTGDLSYFFKIQKKGGKQ